MERPTTVVADVVGTLVAVLAEGATVREGHVVAVIESMKMEYEVRSSVGGVVARALRAVGDAVGPGDELVILSPRAVDSPPPAAGEDVPGERREEFLERVALLADEARPEAVARQSARGSQMVRRSIEQIIDPGTFVEIGRFAFAARTQRQGEDELIRTTPGDGVVAGTARANSDVVGPALAGCAVLAYDDTVLAGTQGQRGHVKMDRLIELASRQELPTLVWADGGGGRPGDTDGAWVSGLATEAFRLFAGLTARVPTIGVATSRCFAGNAALYGCCHVMIASMSASIGMGGPAMIEGGGLGRVAPEDVGPAAVHALAGSVDVVVEDAPSAAGLARRILALAQGDATARDPAVDGPPDARLPRDRRRAYDARLVVEALVDAGSGIELREAFGGSVRTILARIGGRAVALVASNPAVMAGAIDADAADKVARFFQLADAWGLPIVSLLDTPGFMVGPEAEARGLVRHASRMFVAGAALQVPLVAVVTRRAYGLGAQALCGGSFRAPILTVAWPEADMGPMGVEGSVRLGFRREIEAVGDAEDRERLVKRLMAQVDHRGRALNVAAAVEVDDVIDPAITRELIVRVLSGAPRPSRSRRFVDPW